jgi:hypothetical protein
MPLTLEGVATEAFTRTSELGKHANGDIQKRESFTNSRWTYYRTGLSVLAFSQFLSLLICLSEVLAVMLAWIQIL